MPTDEENRQTAAALLRDRYTAYVGGSNSLLEFWKRRTAEYLTMMTDMLAKGDGAPWVSNQVAFAVNTYKEVEDMCKEWRAPSATQPVQSAPASVTFSVDGSSGTLGPITIGSIAASELALISNAPKNQAGQPIPEKYFSINGSGNQAAIALRYGEARTDRGSDYPLGTYVGSIDVEDADGKLEPRATLTVHVVDVA